MHMHFVRTGILVMVSPDVKYRGIVRIVIGHILIYTDCVRGLCAPDTGQKIGEYNFTLRMTARLAH